VPTVHLKRTENCPRRATFSLRVFLPRRLPAVTFAAGLGVALHTPARVSLPFGQRYGYAHE
ncbi:MAG: hypothetical protein WBO73_17610, partial [Gammaproteobacteria bacterium]